MQDIVETLRMARARLLSRVAGLSQAEVTRRPTEDEWSIIEVLAHMIDVDRFYLGEAIAMRDGQDHLLAYFDDDRWKREHPDVRGTLLEDVIRGMQASHAEVLRAAAAMSEEELGRRGRHPRGLPYTVGDVLLRFPAHDENHEQQILTLLSKSGPVRRP
ncbi:MAG TPA: DinB family protein [Dehalococcoidia bacterium]|nr:DinB family protein [Dehalococcoidia bacterium]